MSPDVKQDQVTEDQTNDVTEQQVSEQHDENQAESAELETQPAPVRLPGIAAAAATVPA